MSGGYMSEQQLYNKANAAMDGWMKRGWLREAIRRGDVRPAAKVGQRYLYNDDTLNQLLDMLRVTA